VGAAREDGGVSGEERKENDRYAEADEAQKPSLGPGGIAAGVST
jgi:hypothetical protein